MAPCRNAPGVRGRELTELAAWLYPESQRALGGHVLAALALVEVGR